MFLIQARNSTASAGTSRPDATSTLQAVREMREAGFVTIGVTDELGDQISLADVEKIAVEQAKGVGDHT